MYLFYCRLRWCKTCSRDWSLHELRVKLFICRQWHVETSFIQNDLIHSFWFWKTNILHVLQIWIAGKQHFKVIIVNLFLCCMPTVWDALPNSTPEGAGHKELEQHCLCCPPVDTMGSSWGLISQYHHWAHSDWFHSHLHHHCYCLCQCTWLRAGLDLQMPQLEEEECDPEDPMNDIMKKVHL